MQNYAELTQITQNLCINYAIITHKLRQKLRNISSYAKIMYVTSTHPSHEIKMQITHKLCKIMQITYHEIIMQKLLKNYAGATSWEMHHDYFFSES